ncbi:MAG: PepSY domain-containing protein [Phycisphaerales bacterium]
MRLLSSTILAASATLLAAASASADIGFAQGIAAARAAAPGRTLYEVTHRVRHGKLVYDSALVNAAITSAAEVEVNSASGAIERSEVGPVNPADIAPLTQILAMLPDATIDFPQAIDLAAGFAPAGAVANKASFDLEFNMLAYSVEFNDSAVKVYIDSVTGGQIPQHGADDGAETTIPAGSMTAAIDAGVAASPLPILEAEAEVEDTGTMVEIVQWDGATGEMVTVTVNSGTLAIESIVRWTPTDSQLHRAQDEIDLLPLVTVGASEAVAQALAANPDASFHGIELEADDEGNNWQVELITATGFELDFFVDATSSSGFFVRAPVNFLPADFNRDGHVNGADLGELLGSWGGSNPQYDLDGSGLINGADIALLLGSFN